MFYRKAKRVLAGVCAFTLMLSGVGENAGIVMAAENAEMAVEAEAETEKENDEDSTKENFSENFSEISSESEAVTESDSETMTDESIEKADSETEEFTQKETASETETVNGSEEASSETKETEEKSQTETESENTTIIDEGDVETETENVITEETEPSNNTEASNETETEVSEDTEADNVTEGENIVNDENGVTYILDEETKTITIVASQGSIPDWAFLNDTGIEHVKFQENSKITNVGIQAFKGCTALKSVDFTNCSDLTIIEIDAFQDCTSLEEVKLSSNLQTIRSLVFKGCSSLKEITLTEGLISIGNGAFENCTSLSKVVVNVNDISNKGEDNIDEIKDIFKGCCIDTIEFNTNNTVVPAALFRGATFAENANIEIPEYIQDIGQYAFAGSNLKSITFKGTDNNTSKLASISASAFEGCTTLGAIEFPNSLKIIGDLAFKKCESLKTVKILNTVTALGESAFEGCIGINDLTLSNATINTAINKNNLGKNIFKGCTSLTKVEIPSGITEISEGEFLGCTSLKDLTISNTVKTIGESAFSECSALASLEMPNSVEEIGDKAFKLCISLNNPKLSTNIIKLSDEIFWKCISLETISIPEKVNEIGDKAFQYCSKLNPLELPKALIKIGERAFEGCTSIAALEIPENVTTLGKGVFNGCTSIGTVKISSCKITSCEEGIFANCLIKKVEFPEGITEIPDELFNQAQFVTNTTITIPKTVTKIGVDAFSGVEKKGSNISHIVFEEGSQLNEIGNGAFQYCNAIKSFNIPDSTTIIGQQAFNTCKGLTEITIPENIVFIGKSAFNGCTALNTVNYNAIAAETNVKKASETIFKDCNISKITIGENVTILPGYLFYGAKFSDNNDEAAVLVDLLVPAAVKEIQEYAFANISNIRTVTFEEGSSFTKLGEYAFNSCTALEECILPDNVTDIGNSAFRGCTKLKEFKLPASLVTLGSYAFYQCSSIENYVIPENTEAILDNTFFENTALKTITFEGLNITQIGANAFYGCTNLKEINIPQGTASIGMNAFNGCTQLGTVRIPNSVSAIGEGAFANCPNVKFYVVSGSYAHQWLVANGFESKIQNMHTITYELYDGTNDIRNIGGYLEGDTFTFFPAIKKGYGFRGWFLEETFETEVTDLTGRSGDFKLYAKWEVGTYIINYELDGGTNNEKNPDTYTINSEEIVLEDPTKPGYVFKGWYTDSEFKTKKKNIASGSSDDITLYAKWTAINYTIKFNANGGTGSADDILVVGDTPFVMPAADTFVREGYTLQGFNTDKKGAGTKYEPGECVSAIMETKSEKVNVTLYAQWKKDMLNTVQAPLSNFESGKELLAGTKIILSTKTKGANIYYTLDGSDPTNGGLLYTDSIMITEPTTIRAIAIKDGFNDSIIVNYTYTIVDEASFWGDITEEDRALYESPSKVPNGIWVAGVKNDSVYTGGAIKFELRVYDYKTLLTEKKDYTIKYSNNKKAATKNDKKAPTITITAKGDYKGVEKVKFDILPLDINGENFVAEDMYGAINGKLQKPVPKLTFGKTKLKNKKDFTVSYPGFESGYSAEGDYEITLTGKGNFTGTRTVKFELKNCTLISKVKISKIKAVDYNGEEHTPDIAMTYQGTSLIKDTDYTVEYQNNKDAGTATAIITGIGNYRGVKSVSFKINPIAQLKKTQITFNKSSVDYTGDEIRLNEGEDPFTETVTYEGVALKQGESYIIDSYSKNINKGTATVVFKGIGGYTGTVKKKFKITAADISKANLQFLDENGNLIDGEAVYSYTKGGCKPSIAVIYNGKTLVSGTDYTVKYSGNTSEGTAALTIKGKKNFNGEMTNSFKVAKQDIGKLNITVDDIEYKYELTEDDNYFSKPVIKDLNGKTLKAGTDYDSNVEYTYATECNIKRNGRKVSIKAGDKVQETDEISVRTAIKASVKGKGNYTGSISESYIIVSANISNAIVTIEPQIYTGKAVTPGKDQITVQLNGGTLKATDYEIIGYNNNISKGTATVTLRGNGSFGGTIKAKFKIKQKPFSLAELLSKYFMMN